MSSSDLFSSYLAIPTSESEIADTEAQRQLNSGGKKDLEDHILPKNVQLSLDLFNRIIKQRNDIRNIPIYDIFTAIFCAYNGQNNPYFMLMDNKNLFDISKCNRAYCGKEIEGKIALFEEKGLINCVEKIPYDYQRSKDEKIQAIKRGLEADRLDNELEVFFDRLKTLFPTEEGRKFFFNLYNINKEALYNALYITTLLYVNVYVNNQQVSSDKELEYYVNFYWKVIKKVAEIIERKKDKEAAKIKSIEHGKKILADMEQKPHEIVRITSDIYTDFCSRKSYPLLRYILFSTLEHNAKIYESGSELEKSFNNSCFNYSKLIDSQTDTLLSTRSLEEIKEMLALLTSTKKYDASFDIFNVLLLSTPRIISEINGLVADSRVSQAFVNTEPSIFIDKIDVSLQNLTDINEGAHKDFIENLAGFREHKIDTYTLSNNRFRSILLRNNESNKQVFRLIDSYGLHYGGANDFSLFDNTRLIRIADRFIEHGWEEFIKKNPKYISLQSETYLKRLDFFKAYGTPIKTDDKLPSAITTPLLNISGNLINNGDLDDYIINAVEYSENKTMFEAIENAPVEAINEYDIEELDRFKTSPLTYTIGSIIISRPKVLRNLNILKNNELCKGLDRNILLFNAMIHGSVLDDNEIDYLKNVLNIPKEKLEK